MIFKDRKDAGKKLAKSLESYENNQDTLILALPRGGVVVAHEVAKKLSLPLDIITPRKIGAPNNPELAIGALIEDTILLNNLLIDELNISKDHIRKIVEEEKKEATRRKNLYRQYKDGPLEIEGKEIILIDDGIATGYTILAAVEFLKSNKAKSITIAIPVGPASSIKELSKQVENVVCLYSPEVFYAIGAFYELFPQTSDEEVLKTLKRYPS